MKVLPLALAAAIALAAAPESAQDPALVRFPFVLPWDDDSANAVNVGFLNPAPAGSGGFVRARDGHFFDEQGRRVRFVGVNMAADAAFPTHADAEKIAGRLHKFGVNIVRLHHMDASWTRPNLFASAPGDTQHFNPDAIDRLDYLIYQLKLHGIYSNINLKVSRTFTDKDDVPEAAKLPFAAKPADYFMPRLIALQKSFARDLLTHLNPYTRARYVDEPAVAIVEVNNENSLVGAPWEGVGAGIASLPAPYRAELAAQWNEWLRKKYKTTAGLRRAWSAADKPFGPNRLLNPDFSLGAEHWTLEANTQPAAAKLELPDSVIPPEGVPGKSLRIDVTSLGSQNWNIQLNQPGLDLTDAEPYTVSFWAKADRARKIGVYTSTERGDYHNVGLNERPDLSREWRRYAFAFAASRTEKGRNRLTFVLGDSLGSVDLAGIVLRPGSETQFPAGASLERSDWPLGRPAVGAAGEDWIAFLIDVEQRYICEMRNYIRDTLKAHASVTGSQAAWGGLAGLIREAGSDFVDMHAYWQHPAFPHKEWDPADWRIPNTAMVADPGAGTLPDLARYRLSGKPYTISEYSHPAPNDYQAESVPMLAAFAAMQDWDGFYLFDYGMDRGQNKIAGWFAIDANPAKMALLPAAACMFLRNDLGLANEELRLRLPAERVPHLIAQNGLGIAPEWEAAGVHNLDALNHRLSVSLSAGKPPTQEQSDEHAAGEFITPPAAAGPIRWKPSADRPMFLADSAFSKVMVGMIGGQNVSMPGWQAQCGETERNFGALTLTALDAKPIDHSFKLLLTAVSDVENTGMQWNADRTSVGDHWGGAPTLATGISAAVTINTLVTSATVYALDGTGKRQGVVPSRLNASVLTFQIEPKYKTIWYEVEAAIKR
jgi:hypothetical protein